MAGEDGTGDKWEGVNQLQLKMCLYAAAPVYHDKCHRKINSLCTFGNYNYHFGVIYLLYNTDKGSLFIILKVHLKLLGVLGFPRWQGRWVSAPGAVRGGRAPLPLHPPWVCGVRKAPGRVMPAPTAAPLLGSVCGWEL